MSLNTEKRISQLENELKALKSTYMISGGSMKTYLSYSPVYTITDIVAEDPVRIRFTPSFGNGKDNLVSSFFVEQTYSSGYSANFSQYAVMTKENDGSIIFRIPLAWSVSTLRVGIASTIPGTFTRIS